MPGHYRSGGKNLAMRLSCGQRTGRGQEEQAV